MRNKLYLWLYVAMTGLYAVLSLGLPTDPKLLKQYNITQSHAHLINLAVVIPLLFVWSTAVYAFLRFKSYSETIKDTPEGKPFSHLATGLMILAFSLPILGCVGTLTSYIGYHRPDLLPELTIVKNYLNLLFPLIAFMLIVKGAEELTQTLKRKVILSMNNKALIGLIALTSVYVWLITTRSFGSSGDIVYYMSNWLIISTLAIPYLFVWCKGVVAAYYLNAFQNKTRGIIYRKALRYLAEGIGTIIILSILIQLITTISVRLTRLQLTPLLLVVYVLVALNAVGYGLVARGAKKLKLIEEV